MNKNRTRKISEVYVAPKIKTVKIGSRSVMIGSTSDYVIKNEEFDPID